MTKKNISTLIELLDKEYGTDIICYLNYEEDKPWQLLFATILSAQCTDERVNKITAKLFQKYPTVESFANASLTELEKDIMQAGFFHNKAKSIIGSARILHEKYNDILPNDIDILVTFPGVGRKTANVIRGNIYHIQSIVVDTHVKRVSNLLGLTKEQDPEKIEYALMKLLPEDHWILYNKQIIAHGRNVCIARRPRCQECMLKDICKSYK